MPTEPPFQIDPDILKACIHCGMCLPTCPTYRVTGSEAESPRGRLYLMKQMLDGKLDSPAQLSQHLDLCLGCQACQTACPSGVQYGELLFKSRELLTNTQNPWVRGFKRFIYRYLLPNRDLLSWGASFLRLYQRSGLQHLVRQSGFLNVFPKLRQQEALLPRVPKPSPLNPGMSFGNMDGERVALFLGCVMDTLYHPIHKATLEVLTANGYYVSIPEQTCCGALAFHAGETNIAQELAKENINTLIAHDPQWIVINSAGCGAALKEYCHLLANDPIYGEKAKRFSEKIVDIMELLAQKPLAPMAHAVPQTVTYHAACHLHHAQGVQTQPEAILAQVPGLTLVPLKEADACCGSAGVYNVEHPAISQEILSMKMAHLKATQAEMVVTGNPGCLLQIQAGIQEEGLDMEIRHPIELLAMAYRGRDYVRLEKRYR